MEPVHSQQVLVVSMKAKTSTEKMGRNELGNPPNPFLSSLYKLPKLLPGVQQITGSELCTGAAEYKAFPPNLGSTPRAPLQQAQPSKQCKQPWQPWHGA